MPVCGKMISSWERKVLGIAKPHMYHGTFKVLQCLQLWWLVFSWCPFCRQATGPEFLPQPDIIFLLPSLLCMAYLTLLKITLTNAYMHIYCYVKIITGIYIKNTCLYIQMWCTLVDYVHNTN